MEINYRREIKHNYLVITPDAEWSAGYEARMLAGNEIQGLLRMHIRYQDGYPFYYYDITSRQPLSRLLETRFITRDEICQILIQTHVALMRMEEFLLGDEGILLDPEMIYVDPELFQIGLCLVPGRKEAFPQQLSRFLQYILKCVNHKDRECVVLAYGMYQESLKDNYGIDDILKLVAAERDTGEERRNIENNQGDTEKNRRNGEVNGKFREGDQKEQQEDGGDNSDSEYENRSHRASDIDAAACINSPKMVNPVKPPFSCFLKQAGLWLAAAVLAPVAVWMFWGLERLMEMKLVLIYLDAGLLVIIAVRDIFLLCMNRRKGVMPGKEPQTEPQYVSPHEAEDSPWRIMYEDEDETDPYQETDSNEKVAGSDGTVNRTSEPADSEMFQTTLLCGEPDGDGLHRLRALEDGGENIILSYYPFVIGKNKNLSDYVLQKDTVSRFHLRIDCGGTQYTVTDLNSTNGTKVNGRMLDANETAAIEVGDEIWVADVGFLFD